MRFQALAVDYDGTLAEDGRVDDETLAALLRLKASGRRLVMVTGRELEDLRAVFARVDVFDVVVGENGGVLLRPASGSVAPLGPPPPAALVEALRARGVRMSVGAVIVATWEAHRGDVCAVIDALRLDREVILNKAAVMVLPRGVNKGSGVARAAAALSIPVGAIVGIGDAENDGPLLRTCGVGIAVANALPSLKAEADAITRGARGAGVAEIIDRLLRDDLAGLTPRARGLGRG